MKKYLSILLVVLITMFSNTCYGGSKYKGFLNVGGSVMSGDTYQYVMGCDGKIGLSLSTEHGVSFNMGKHGFFFGAGLGFDYVNVALDSFDPNELETKNILSNSVMAIPMYLTIKFNYNIERVSMIYAIRGGYYKWFRGHYVNEQAQAKDYKIPYQGGYTLGFGVGVRLPINNRYGVSLVFNYDYMGANTKWQDDNIANSKAGISVGFDF